MSPLVELELAAAAFVGTHFLMSHPLRKWMVRTFGNAGFLGVYSLVSFATLGWMIWAALKIPAEPPYWNSGTIGWTFASLLGWLASILLVGSFVRNPAFPDPTGKGPVISRPHGVFRITRHPMMWSFAFWAIAHAIVNPTPSGLIIDEAIGVLAIVGAALQDRKKEKLLGERWASWVKQTSFVPFGRGIAAPGWPAFIGGTLLFFAATWAHGALGYREAGFWPYFA